MQVVLNKDVAKLGYRGEVVKVKNGYFRNFLLPRGLALLGSVTALKVAASRTEKILLEKKRLMENAKEALGKLKGLKLTFTKKATSKGRLYGAIAEADVVKAILEAKNVKFEKDWIKMDHIKAIGEHTVKIHLGEGLEQSVDVIVKEA